MATVRSVRGIYWVFRRFNSFNSLYPYCQNVAQKGLHSSAFFNAEGIPIKMPSLSPTMTEGTIVKWLKKEGEEIASGDIICDIQTDKAVVGYELDEDGTLAKIIVPEDTKDIKVGTLIALMVEEGADWKDVKMPALEQGSEQPSTVAAAAEVKSDKGRLKEENFGPSVRLLLEKYGLTPEGVPAGGPHGRLLKGDVLTYIKSNRVEPQPPKKAKPPSIVGAGDPSTATAGTPTSTPLPSVKVTEGVEFDDIELTNMRRTIAKRLSQSKSTVAHAYCTLECRIDSILKMRKTAKTNGVSFSVNDAIIKACAVALLRCPEVNTVWEGNQPVQKSQADISVAVATPAGLITPIVKGADVLGLEEISKRIKDLATRAKNNQLKLDEFQGGTFTISNLGMFGIREFSAIINQPQCAILAVGGGIVTLDEFALPETRMRATLSYDRAAIADDEAAHFMSTLKEVLEEPETMLLGSFPRSDYHKLSGLL